MFLPKAIFIDRDGTIGGSEHVIYPGEFELYPNVETSIVDLKELDFLIISFTNQPGISRGEAKREDYEKELKGFGFDKVFICPHQHMEGCSCRKPSIGMLLQAAKENNLELEECIVIGDRWTDLIAANEVKCLKILVKTGAGKEAYHKYKNQEYFGSWADVEPDFIAENFQEAVCWIKNRESRFK
nr:HAD-IIIA family hydrolase [Ornithinibacillus californiensis]